MKNTFFTSHALKLLMLVTFLLPIVLMGAKITLRSNRNDVKEWLPASYRETDEYKWFQKNFTNETFVLVSWDGCTLDDERLKILSAKLMPDRGDTALPAKGSEAVREVDQRPDGRRSDDGAAAESERSRGDRPAPRLDHRARSQG